MSGSSIHQSIVRDSIRSAGEISNRKMPICPPHLLKRLVRHSNEFSVTLTGQERAQLLPRAVELCIEPEGLQLVGPGMQGFGESF